MTTVSHAERAGRGSSVRFADSVILSCSLVVPVTFALLHASSSDTSTRGRSASTSAARSGSLPARSSTAAPIYPEPTRDAVVIGNPTVYPPLFILASIPLALLPVDARVVALVLPARRRRVRRAADRRRPRLALPRARGHLAGRRARPLLREPHGPPRPAARARVALPRPARASPGSPSGVAVAAKLFVWPLVVWLLLTRRFRAAAWAVGSAAVLVARRRGR